MSVSVRKRGNKYQASAALGVDHKTGKYLRKTFTGKTRSEARKLAEDYERRFRAGIDISLGAMTFSELATTYWQTYTTEKQPANSTQYTYRKELEQLNEVLGNIPFHKITSAQLRDAVYGANTASMSKLRWIVLRGIFKWAMEESPPLIEVNPMANIKKPVEPKKREPVIYTKEQLAKLLDAAKGTRLENALYIQYALALRIGELRGLRWRDIEIFDKPGPGKSGVATIQWQLPSREGIFSVEEMFIPTKGKDKRELPINADLARLLKQIHVEQHKAALRLGNLWHDMDLVLPRMIVDRKKNYAGGCISYFVYMETLKKILEKARIGGPAYSHAFRHTAAAHMLSSGIALTLVSKYLGHTMIATTDQSYGHLVSNALDELPAALLRRA